MKRLVVVLCVFVAALGCKSFKDQQVGAYVGDSQTKVVYKNVAGNVNKIPDANRVYFRGVEQATEAGYTLNNESTAGGAGDKDE